MSPYELPERIKFNALLTEDQSAEVERITNTIPADYPNHTVDHDGTTVNTWALRTEVGIASYTVAKAVEDPEDTAFIHVDVAGQRTESFVLKTLPGTGLREVEGRMRNPENYLLDALVQPDDVYQGLTWDGPPALFVGDTFLNLESITAQPGEYVEAPLWADSEDHIAASLQISSLLASQRLNAALDDLRHVV